MTTHSTELVYWMGIFGLLMLSGVPILVSGQSLDNTSSTLETAAGNVTASIRPITMETTPPSSSSPLLFPVSSGTNFKLGIPFNFSNIYIVGGSCKLTDDFYSVFATAGMLTLGLKPLHNLCSDQDYYSYTTDFLRQALLRVHGELAQDTLNQTLVITMGFGLPSPQDWTTVANLMRQGMAFFHADIIASLPPAASPTTMDLAAYGLEPDKVLYFHYQVQESKAIQQAGAELCRIMGYPTQIIVAMLYTAQDQLRYRVDGILEAFQQTCPETQINQPWSLASNVTDQAIRDALLSHSLPDVILTDHDGLAKRILDLAKETLLPHEYSRLTTTGWDNTYHSELLQQHLILTSADSHLLTPQEGFWNLMRQVIQTIQQQGINSSQAMMQQHMDQLITAPLDHNNYMHSQQSTLVTSDPIGYTLHSILERYPPTIPPSANVLVSTGLRDVVLTQMLPWEGTMETVLWLRLSWHDRRLAFRPQGPVTAVSVDRDLIWTPHVVFGNEYQQHTVLQAPTPLVHANGTVVWETNLRLVTLCPSATDNRHSYPFDMYECSILVQTAAAAASATTTMGPGICLDATHGLEVLDSSDPHLEITTTMTTTMADNHNVNVCRPHYHSPRATTTTTVAPVVEYHIKLERPHETAFVRLVLPGIVINLVGFISFWIPEMTESVILSITSLLCALVFRTSVDRIATSNMTWAELFLLVQMIYQSLVMFILWCSYGQSKLVALSLGRVTKWHRKRQPPPQVDNAPTATKQQSSTQVTTPRQTKATASNSNGITNKKPSKPPKNDDGGSTKQGSNTGSDNEEGPDRKKTVVSPTMIAPTGQQPQPNAQQKQVPSQDGSSSGNHPPAVVKSINVKHNPQQHQDDHSSLTSQQPLQSESISTAYHAGFSEAWNSKSEDDQETSLDGRLPNGGLITVEVESPRGHNALEDDKDNEEDENNVDWIGRWLVVPSYLIVMTTLIAHGWGFA